LVRLPGTELAGERALCAGPRHRCEVRLMFCAKCGTQAVDGANFCAGCGAQLPTAKTGGGPAAATGEPKKSRRLWFWLSGLVLVGLGVSVALLQDHIASRGTDSDGTNLPVLEIIALSQRPEHVEPDGTYIDYETSELSYGLGGQSSGKSPPRPSGFDSFLPAAEQAPPPPAEKPKMAMAAPAPKTAGPAMPAPAAKPARTSVAAPAAPAGKTIKTTRLTATLLDDDFNPNWDAYHRQRDVKQTPRLYVEIEEAEKHTYFLSIARWGCETPAYGNFYPECTNHSADAVFDVVVSLDGGESKSFDCPVHAKPENGCDQLWREKGAAVIAAAKSTK
jgi:hypothetical protein